MDEPNDKLKPLEDEGIRTSQVSGETVPETEDQADQVLADAERIIEEKPTVADLEPGLPATDGEPIIQSPEQPAAIAGGAIAATPSSTLLILVKDKLVEKSPEIILKPKGKLKRSSRRDFLVYGSGMIALSAGFWWLLPDETKAGLGFASAEDALKRKLLNGALSFDDLVAQSLFSQTRLVPTYSKSQMTEVPNNYAGQTPDEDIIPKWELHVKGLASNREAVFSSAELMKEFPYHEQITRLVCVEGWSAISGWGGLRFADFMRRYPPRSDCKWIQLRSDVNLDSDGKIDPYFVSFDLQSAMHPQTLLATHHNGKPLEIEHGAPLRLLAPMKLGLKNIKAITSIVYSTTEPDDYWNQNGYSYYDGI